MRSYTLLNGTRQTVIAAQAELADSAHARRVGLLKYDRLELGRGLVIPGRDWIPLMAIHTFRMRYSIDVFFLDKQKRVLHLCTVPPNRMASVIGARWVLETAEGTITVSRTRQGDTLEMTTNP